MYMNGKDVYLVKCYRIRIMQNIQSFFLLWLNSLFTLKL